MKFCACMDSIDFLKNSRVGLIKNAKLFEAIVYAFIIVQYLWCWTYLLLGLLINSLIGSTHAYFSKIQIPFKCIYFGISFLPGGSFMGYFQRKSFSELLYL